MGEPTAEIECDRAEGADRKSAADEAQQERRIETLKNVLLDQMHHGSRLSRHPREATYSPMG